MTSAERTALLFLSGVAVLGAGVRVVRARGEDVAPTAASREALARHIQRVDSAERARGAGRGGGRRAAKAPRRPRSARRAAPAEPTRERSDGRRAAGPVSAGPVDLDAASAAEIERLPRIGPALARRIVASRDSLGPFGEIGAVERVRGVGPKVAAAIAPHVTFSGRRRPSSAVPPLSGGTLVHPPPHRPRT